MTDAFTTNLRAMSLLALLVGTFLIYGAVSFAVLQRRSIIGVLRALGATRAEVLGVILAEGALLGVIGAACGVLLGVLIGHALVGLVSRTINDLYFVVAVNEVDAAARDAREGAGRRSRHRAGRRADPGAGGGRERPAARAGALGAGTACAAARAPARPRGRCCSRSPLRPSSCSSTRSLLAGFVALVPAAARRGRRDAGGAAGAGAARVRAWSAAPAR